MSVTPGARIGPYDVTALIGAGGMGQVFRARDRRLNRDVALKVLPREALTSDARRSRFEREAQVLAALNNSNIAQIFGVEDADGAPVIVMELVDGATLAERIAAGPLPLDDALSIALQLCAGLDAAHERGVVHRDLKPANVKVRPDGALKILDFGLARAVAEDGDSHVANAATVTGARTELGVVLGTAAYMSPEQARAQTVDRRADIWAFGCVLYEMLTGAKAFSGQSTADILLTLLQREPDWSALPAAVPLRIRELLHRCLKKNPKDRLRDIADARYQIEEVLRPSSREAHSATLPAATAPRSPAAWRVPFAAFVLGALITYGLVRAIDRMQPAVNDAGVPTRAIVTLPPNTTLALGRGSAVILSPDGRYLVFTGRAAGKVQLYLHDLSRFDASPIAGTDDASNPFFSGDGRWVGFFAERKLKKVAIEGGGPVTVADALNPRGQMWAPDDTIIFTPSNNSGLTRVSALGGTVQPLTQLQTGELSHRWPSMLPDGRTLLFSLWNDTGWEPARIAAQRLGEDSRSVVVPAGGGYPRYIRDGDSETGYLVYSRAEGLLAARFDEARLKLVTQPKPVVDGVITNLSGGSHFDLSASGTLAYVPGTIGEADRDLVWVSRDGKSTPARRIRNMSRFWTMAPDGSRLVRTNTSGPNREVWVEDLARGASTRLTISNDNYNPVWSHDGQWIAYARGLPNSAIYRQPATGGAEEQLTTNDKNHSPGDFSPDGKTLAYVEFDPITGSDIWVLSLGERAARVFVKTQFSEGTPEFSPDGRWIAYASNVTGRFEIYVRSFPDGERMQQLSADGGFEPMWSPKGNEVFYRGTNGQMMSVSLAIGTDVRASAPVALFDVTAFENVAAVAPDGLRFLMMALVDTEQAATQVRLVFNFVAELRQRVR